LCPPCWARGVHRERTFCCRCSLSVSCMYVCSSQRRLAAGATTPRTLSLLSPVLFKSVQVISYPGAPPTSRGICVDFASYFLMSCRVRASRAPPVGVFGYRRHVFALPLDFSSAFSRASTPVIGPLYFSQFRPHRGGPPGVVRDHVPEECFFPATPGLFLSGSPH